VLARTLGFVLAALFLTLSFPRHAWDRLRFRGKLGASGRPAAPAESARERVRKERAASERPSAGSGLSLEPAIAAYAELIDLSCAETSTVHVAMVIPTLDRMGGAERQARLLAVGLRRRGWRVTVVALSGTGGAAAAELRTAGVDFLSLSMRKGLADPRGWVRFVRWLRRNKPDVVHAHLPHAAWLARWSRLLAPVPVVIDTLHSASTGGPRRRLGYRISRALPDQVTAVSQSVADCHISARMVPAAALTIQPNGIAAEEWRPDAQVRAEMRREMGLGDEFLWLAVGRLEMVKDFPTLLKAMVAVPSQARLVIAGGGPLLPNLARLASHHGLRDRVKFLGFEPKVMRWYQAADGFVLASRWEGLPMALLEAAACALPAVATDVPGSSEVILDGETGTLVPPADVSALAWAMTAMMRTSPEERSRMGAAARERVLKQFSLESCFDRWEELYFTLFNRNSRETAVERADLPGPVEASVRASVSGPRSVF
jgi:glycosyltransferase involved in cell wall biosynthesis